MTNAANVLKTNKAKIVKGIAIAGAVAATIIVVGVLYKANVDAHAEIAEIAKDAIS